MSMSKVADSNDGYKWDEARFPLFCFQNKWLKAMIAITLGINNIATSIHLLTWNCPGVSELQRSHIFLLQKGM
jgi:hypothetical protein